MWFDSLIVSEKKLYQTKTCSIESYNIEIKHEEK